MPSRECPMCGERMRLKRREQTSVIPGTGDAVRRQAVEWECPECDYFEEAGEDEEDG